MHKGLTVRIIQPTQPGMNTQNSVNSTIRTIVLDDTSIGERLDRALAVHLPDISRTRLQALIRADALRLDGEPALDPSLRIPRACIALLDIPEPEPAEPEGENIPLSVVYEDEALIVIDKPAGLVVHPAAGHATGTLVNALIAHCGDTLSGIGGVKRPGIVHRLDKDTSGLLVVAKSDAAHQGLADQFADHGRTGPLERAYLALLWGGLDRPRGTISAPIDRDSRNRERMAVVKPGRGREAITHWERLKLFTDAAGTPLASFARCLLETGRTHQIRVHMTQAGHPLMGDTLYGTGFRTKATRLTDTARAALDALNRQALHATLLGFAHPVTGETMRFESPPPADMAALIAALRAQD
jgi:23S rRNA pseudouridine1911/1915/1917 synthase